MQSGCRGESGRPRTPLRDHGGFPSHRGRGSIPCRRVWAGGAVGARFSHHQTLVAAGTPRDCAPFRAPEQGVPRTQLGSRRLRAGRLGDRCLHAREGGRVPLDRGFRRSLLPLRGGGGPVLEDALCGLAGPLRAEREGRPRRSQVDLCPSLPGHLRPPPLALAIRSAQLEWCRSSLAPSRRDGLGGPVRPCLGDPGRAISAQPAAAVVSSPTRGAIGRRQADRDEADLLIRSAQRYEATPPPEVSPRKNPTPQAACIVGSAAAKVAATSLPSGSSTSALAATTKP